MKLDRLGISFLGFFLLLYSVNSLWADIYAFKDNSGVRHFTCVPTNPKYKIYLEGTGSVVWDITRLLQLGS